MDYDQIGRTYASTRQPDPRLRAAIAAHVPAGATVADIGAGTGSYELPETVVAIEPSAAMIGQRLPGTAPAVRGVAEALPLRDDAVDVVTAVLTAHHWTDRAAGLAECRRVARQRVVLLTFVPPLRPYWLTEYFRDLATQVLDQFPAVDVLADELGCPVEVHDWPVPHDCIDGFQGAWWRRPEAYFAPLVRGGISSFHRLSDAELDDGLSRLRSDLDDGTWALRNGHLLGLEDLDLGYRIVVADLTSG